MQRLFVHCKLLGYEPVLVNKTCFWHRLCGHPISCRDIFFILMFIEPRAHFMSKLDWALGPLDLAFVYYFCYFFYVFIFTLLFTFVLFYFMILLSFFLFGVFFIIILIAFFLLSSPLQNPLTRELTLSTLDPQLTPIL